MKMKVHTRTFLEVMGALALVLVVMGLVISSTAHATGRDNDDQQQEQDQNQGQDQHQGQEQGQNQHQTASAAASSTQNQQQGNQQAVTFTSPDDITVRNTASARPPNFNATSPCFSGWSAGVGVAGANIGGGKSKRDPECDMRETARLLAGLGEVKLAIELACQTEAAKKLTRCGFTNDNVYMRVNENHPPAPPVTVHVEDTSKAQEICDKSVDRAFKECVSK